MRRRSEAIAPVHEPLGRLTERAQAAGSIMPDLAGEDVVCVIGMIASSHWSFPEGEQGRRRYLRLIFDAFRPAAPLPPPSPLPGS
ncbi:hypothetical protein O1R50_15260 [Glycomyces luteolus]|uniref:TetR family transcriptional regulator n=1 Tax=Glycomyces luteolus TaxID=2670330 RepID=A0A9X3SU55_9ACTN|nr:hypothetical protein [Glycomyces luteolus]MDA1360988.1 hypothetical protein [Glycomyces luteolus]